jgi:hypothetical protein
MNIYNRLPNDIQEKVDKQVWNKTKQDIPDIELVYRQLKYNLQNYNHNWSNTQKKIIDFVCWYVFRTRTYGLGHSGCSTHSGKYEYKNSKKINPNVNLGMYLKIYNLYLERKIKKPNYEDIFDNIRLAIDNWVDNNILNKELFQHFANVLGFNIVDMFEYYYDNTGENPFEDHNYLKVIFCLYLIDMFDKIIVITYGYEIEDLDSDSDTDTLEDFLNDGYNDPSDLGVGDILVPSAYDLQFG